METCNPSEDRWTFSNYESLEMKRISMFIMLSWGNFCHIDNLGEIVSNEILFFFLLLVQIRF